MEIFYSNDIRSDIFVLSAEESGHAVKVLRHRAGDEICVIDGEGTMYRCVLLNDSPKAAEAKVIESYPNWGGHDYELSLAVCPTKNNDRYEWFVEKATEIGVDRIIPVIGEHSERKVLKVDRVKRVALSATKQSLKAKLPQIDEVVSVKDFINSFTGDALKLIAYCFEGETERQSIKKVLNEFNGKKVLVMIGPEGDFSKEEAELAISKGFIPVNLGDSRLRTETAAVTSAAAVYFKYMD